MYENPGIEVRRLPCLDFLLQMSVLSVSDVIISEERKVIKIWRQNQLVGIRKPTLVDKKKCNV